MKNFTYENQDNRKMYETYEWDNTWIDNTNRDNCKRVLYIGDSISCGIRQIATQITKGEFIFDGYGSSKGIDNPYFINSIKLLALQEGKQDFVLFNNGLHGWHLDDENEYKSYFEKMVKFLIGEFKNIPVMLVLTTYVADKEREKRVIIRNQVVSEIAEKYKLPVIDLHNESLERKNLLKKDGVHFVKKGYIHLAKKVVASVKQIISE